MITLKEIKDNARQAYRDQQSQDTEGGVPDVVSFVAGYVECAKEYHTQLTRKDEIIKVMKEALRFYDERAVFERLNKFPGDNDEIDVSHIARQALKQLEGI